MRKKIQGLVGLALLGLIFVLPTSCADTVDCFRACNAYSDCVADIDVTECTDICEDRADASQATEDALATCDACLEDRSCQEIDEAGCFDNCPIAITLE